MFQSIRVFLSSTFLDMQEERDYLNRVVFPKFKLLCQQRGVLFFACDLRWGITEAQAQNKKTVELCLNQVEKSIPFFIGLLGNRYGWIPGKEDVSSDVLSWYDASLCYSATEIEFSYFCKKTLTYANSFFARKAESLLCKIHDDNQPEKILHFLERIHRETCNEIFQYDSIEVLGDKIYSVLSSWLNSLFPVTDLQNQITLYQNLLDLRDQEHNILGQFQREETQKYNPSQKPYNPFLYAGDSYYGYDYFSDAISRFKYLVLIEPEGSELICNRYWHYASRNCCNEKIFICVYLDASPDLCNAYAICDFILDGLKHNYPELLNDCDIDMESELRYSLDHLTKQIELMLSKIPENRPLAICLTNTHLLNPCDANYSLSFLGRFYGEENVSIYISTNDKSQTELLAAIGIPVRNFPILKEEGKPLLMARFQRTLQNNGKEIESEYIESLLLSGDNYSDKDISDLAEYLINYTTYETINSKLQAIINGIKQKENITDCILQQQMQNITNKERDNAIYMLGILRIISLDESQLFEVMNVLANVNQIEFANSLNAIRPILRYTNQGFIVKNNFHTKMFQLPKLDNIAVSCLCSIFFERLHQLKDIPQLETAYVLLNLILSTGSVEDAVSFAIDNTIFSLAKKYDYHLLRRVWIFLIDTGYFDVKKLYTNEFSLDNPSRNYSKCDLIMKLENSIFIDSKMESFLDIPFTYSTDIEQQFKEHCTTQERRAIEEFRILRKNGQLCKCAEMMERFVKRDDLSRDFIAYVYENLLAYKKEQGLEISKEEVKQYFFMAFYRNNLRMIADALSYFEEYIKAQSSSTDFHKAILRFMFYQPSD